MNCADCNADITAGFEKLASKVEEAREHPFLCLECMVKRIQKCKPMGRYPNAFDVFEFNRADWPHMYDDSGRLFYWAKAA